MPTVVFAQGVPPTTVEPWFFLLACLGVVLAAYLLYQSSRLQKLAGAVAGDTTPHTDGFLFGVGISILVGVVGSAWLGRQLGMAEAEDVTRHVLRDPSVFIPIPLLMLVPPAAIACYQFLVAGVGLRGSENSLEKSRSLGAAIVGGMVSLLTIAASIATLIMFFR